MRPWTPIRLFVLIVGGLAVTAARNGVVRVSWTEWILFFCLILIGIDLFWRPRFHWLDLIKTDRNEKHTTLNLTASDDDQPS